LSSQVLDAAKAAFLPEAEKRELVATIETKLAALDKAFPK